MRRFQATCRSCSVCDSTVVSIWVRVVWKSWFWSATRYATLTSSVVFLVTFMLSIWPDLRRWQTTLLILCSRVHLTGIWRFCCWQTCHMSQIWQLRSSTFVKSFRLVMWNMRLMIKLWHDQLGGKKLSDETLITITNINVCSFVRLLLQRCNKFTYFQVFLFLVAVFQFNSMYVHWWLGISRKLIFPANFDFQSLHIYILYRKMFHIWGCQSTNVESTN